MDERGLNAAAFRLTTRWLQYGILVNQSAQEPADPPICRIVIRGFCNHEQSTGPDRRSLRCGEDRIARSVVGSLETENVPLSEAERAEFDCRIARHEQESFGRDPLGASQSRAV